MPNRCQTSIIRSAAPTSRSPRRTWPLRAWTTSESARWGQVAACAANIALASPSFIRPSTAAEASITINGLLARPRHLRRRHRRRLRGPAARPAAQGCRRDVRWKRARAWRTRRGTGPPSQRDAPSARRPRQARSAGTRSACRIMLALRLHFARVLITARPTSAQVRVGHEEGIDRHLRPSADGSDGGPARGRPSTTDSARRRAGGAPRVAVLICRSQTSNSTATSRSR